MKQKTIIDLSDNQQQLVFNALRIIQEAIEYDGNEEISFESFLSDPIHKNIISISFHQAKANEKQVKCSQIRLAR